MDFGKRLSRAMLVLSLGFLGSFIINHSGLRIQNFTSRTGMYFIFSSSGIYNLIGFFSNLCFDPHSAHNSTYKRSDPINRLSVEDETAKQIKN